MRLERRTAGALAAGALLLTGGGAALAASGDGSTTPSAKCDQRLAKAAETRGVSVEQLRSEIQAGYSRGSTRPRRQDASRPSARRSCATA